MGACGQFRLREKSEPGGNLIPLKSSNHTNIPIKMRSGSYLYDMFFSPEPPVDRTHKAPRKSKKPKKKESKLVKLLSSLVFKIKKFYDKIT